MHIRQVKRLKSHWRTERACEMWTPTSIVVWGNCLESKRGENSKTFMSCLLLWVYPHFGLGRSLTCAVWSSALQLYHPVYRSSSLLLSSAYLCLLLSLPGSDLRGTSCSHMLFDVTLLWMCYCMPRLRVLPCIRMHTATHEGIWMEPMSVIAGCLDAVMFLDVLNWQYGCM